VVDICGYLNVEDVENQLITFCTPLIATNCATEGDVSMCFLQRQFLQAAQLLAATKSLRPQHAGPCALNKVRFYPSRMVFVHND